MTYRRAPLAVPQGLPVITTVTYGGRTREITWAEETVQLKDYGDARQITLSEHGTVALQILTSDLEACPADILSWLKSRWREENFLKYASENYGIDKICDYLAEHRRRTPSSPATPPATRPSRRPRRRESPRRRRTRARRPARQPGPHPRGQERPHPRPAEEDHPGPPETRRRHRRPQTPSPRNSPPATSTPRRRPRCCAPGSAACRWSCGSWRTTPSTGSANHLNAYLGDDDEYRAITRETIIRGLAGTITSTPAAITVTPRSTPSARVARALGLLTEEINASPPAMPGDTRPITYQITPHRI